MDQHKPVAASEDRSDAPADEAPGRVTPMMEQYVEIRAANPDCLLFYRMGDFYELFFDDAVTASRALGITLTRRGKHLGEDIAMCGVPIHAADDYLQKLIALGYRVAVCEQTEDPAEARRRGGKSVVRRAVTRLVTPGTITEERLLEAGRNNFLAALVRTSTSSGAPEHALAWVDISTGEFRTADAGAAGTAALLARVEPREVLVADRLAAEAEVRSAVDQIGAALTPLPATYFDGGSAETRLCGFFEVKSLEAFGSFTRAELIAGAALLAYVEKTQVSKRPRLEPPRRDLPSDHMRLDAATRANLELFRTISGSRSGSLLAAIDRTCTAAGARLLAERLASPLCDPGAIERRLESVQLFVDRPALRADMRAALATVPDTVRALSRLGLDRGGPRDLDSIRAGLEAGRSIQRRLVDEQIDPGHPLTALAGELARAGDTLAENLAEALDAELPLLKRDGGFVRRGFRGELDAARALRDESRRVIAALQARYAEASGIKGLKIRHNNMLGYFVEVGAAHAPALSGEPGGVAFFHRQTMAGAMRFSTAELAELEQEISGAAERALAIELRVFDELAGEVAVAEAGIRAGAAALAELDVAAGLAELAVAEEYVRPRIDGSSAFRIEGGRHPIVEQALKRSGQRFVGNDSDLGASADGIAVDPAPGSATETGASGGPGKVWLITGPNMAGKSTFLRQNALVAILAQAGSFVPARAAHIGVCDAVFSRVGAADDLARGRSTFMVEMVETAAILNQAGPRALVILDEIGRGTATFDGLSIAWAAIEHLHEVNRCRTLFATHYHELTGLAAKLPRLVNATMRVKEWKGDVVFLHEVVPGAADRSYGIQVAKLAGLPSSVVRRARQVLDSLERSDRSRPRLTVDDLPLFASRAPEPTEAPHPALAALAAINPDELSPKEALERLYELKRLGE